MFLCLFCYVPVLYHPETCRPVNISWRRKFSFCQCSFSFWSKSLCFMLAKLKLSGRLMTAEYLDNYMSYQVFPWDLVRGCSFLFENLMAEITLVLMWWHTCLFYLGSISSTYSTLLFKSNCLNWNFMLASDVFLNDLLIVSIEVHNHKKLLWLYYRLLILVNCFEHKMVCTLVFLFCFLCIPLKAYKVEKQSKI